MTNGDLGNGQAIVLINRHEPEGEATSRLLEIARDKGYDDSVVVAQRGEHDVALSWRVPQDVAEEFNGERDSNWPAKIENDDETDTDQHVAGVDGDAYAADSKRNANTAAVANAVNDNGDPNNSPATKRPGKTKE